MWGTPQFSGSRPRLSQRRLQPHIARLARDCWLSSRTVRPIAELGAAVGAGAYQTIYRFSPTQWFAWNIDVDVVPGPIRNDVLRRTYWTGQDFPRYTDTTIMGGFVGPGIPTSRRLGVPAPTSAAMATVATFGAMVTLDEMTPPVSATWTYTYVTDKGEEGPPAPPSSVETRRFDADGNIETVNLSGMERGPTGPYNATRKRIYRSVTGFEGTTYRLLAEVAVGVETYTDNVQDVALGAALASTLWDPPPDNLEGLVGLANGVLAGFVDRDIYLSEPFQPHAWPRDYIQVTDSPIVGLDSYGTTLVVGTKGKPYLVTGSHPATAVPNRQELQQSCVSKRSFARLGEQGVVYASPEGLVLVGPGGGRIISREVYALREWEALGAADIKAFYHDNQLLLFLGDKAVAFDPETATVSEFDDDISAGYLDEEADRLYVVSTSPPPAPSGFGIATIPTVAGEVVRMLITAGSDSTWYSRFDGEDIGSISPDSDNLILADPTPGEETIDVDLSIDRVRWESANNYMLLNRIPKSPFDLDTGFAQWVSPAQGDNYPFLQLSDTDPGNDLSVYLAFSEGTVHEVRFDTTFALATPPQILFIASDAALRVAANAVAAGDQINLVIGRNSDFPAPAAGGIREWSSTPGNNPRAYRWESGIMEGPARTYSAAQVIADAYPVTFRIHGDAVSFEKTVTGRAGFRLPDTLGNRADWRFELEGTVEVQEVRIGAMDEMLGT